MTQYQKIVTNIVKALEGKKIIRLAHTIDEGLDLTVMPEIPQEIWYKYPTVAEDHVRHVLEEKGINCVRPFPNNHRDRDYYYDHLMWKIMADGYLEKMEEEPIFYSYKNSTHFDEVCEEYGFRSFMPNYSVFKELQHKANLENYGVSPDLGLIPFFEIEMKDLDYEDAVKRLGDPFVVQFSFQESGWNTYGSQDTHIIYSRRDLEDVTKNYPSDMKAKVSKFIHGIPAATIVVATARGPLVNAPYFQITGEPHLTQGEEGNRLLFCGGNYRHKGKLSDKAKDKIIKIGQSMGNELYNKQYQGIFGLDIMIEDGTDEVYVLEINPRLSGTTMSTNLLASKKNQLPLIGMHMAEYLRCIPESFDMEEYQKEIQDQTDFAFFFPRYRGGELTQIKEAPTPGIYKYKADGKVEFVKEAYNFDDLPNKDHFLVTRIWPRMKNLPPALAPYEIWTLEDAFDDIILNEKYRSINDQIYEMFEFVPADSFDSSVPYKVE